MKSLAQLYPDTIYSVKYLIMFECFYFFILDLIELFLKKNFNGFPVRSKDLLVGIFNFKIRLVNLEIIRFL